MNRIGCTWQLINVAGGRGYMICDNGRGYINGGFYNFSTVLNGNMGLVVLPTLYGKKQGVPLDAYHQHYSFYNGIGSLINPMV
jgi:hypothetical protein